MKATRLQAASRAGWTRRRWLGTGAAAAATWGPGAAVAAQAGDLIPWPALQTVDGRPLAAIGPGVPVIVVFWATWCGYCQRHNARIDALHRTVDAQRLRILGAAQDGDADAVQQYLRRHGYRFPNVLDRSGALRARFTERRILPMTCTVGADGRLLQSIPGEMSEDDVIGLARLALPAR